MDPVTLDIGPWRLGLTLVFVLAAGGVSLAQGLGLERDLLKGSLRTFVQLFVMGYALKVIFGLQSGLLVLAVFSLMIAFAARIVRDRVGESRVAYMLPTMGAMLATYMLVAVTVTSVVVGVRPWWEPHYFLPLGGMIIGNSMTALSLCLERLFKGLGQRRAEVEMMLCLGADPAEASREIFREAIKAGMIPSINSMMGVGVVFIPGMMTGQILAGADPMTAIRYQIVVMFMLVASTALSSIIVAVLVRRRCFGAAQNLLLREEGGPTTRRRRSADHGSSHGGQRP